jgi:hypothetical protein
LYEFGCQGGKRAGNLSEDGADQRLLGLTGLAYY